MTKYILILLFIPLLGVGQSQNQNYIKNVKYKVPFTGNTFIEIDENGNPIGTPSAPVAETDKVETITYIDGLGRPVQTIKKAQSNSGKDIVLFNEYETSGNQIKEYLPYVSQASSSLNYINTVKNKLLAFYSTNNISATGNPAFETTTIPYSEKLLDNSSYNRVIKQAAPGEAWSIAGNNIIRMNYRSNSINEVKHYKINTTYSTSSGLYDNNLINGSGTVYYPAGQLYKTVTKNENWSSGTDNTTEEFKDKNGKILLKRTYNGSEVLDTYYIYDEFGNLTFVLPPLLDTTSTITAAVLDGLCYQYKYDNKNRLVEKKIPGKQWEFIVYDKLDRVVATGPNMNPFGDGTLGWMISKYDAFDRIVYTGWIKGAVSSTLRTNLQSSYTNSSTLNESRVMQNTIDGFAVGYTNAVSINLSGTFSLLTVNYYDDYTFPNAPSIPTTIATSDLDIVSSAKGLATGSLVRVFENTSNGKANISYILYDKKFRAVENYTQNYMGGYTKVDTNLDWMGKTIYTVTKHKRTDAEEELVVNDSFTYSLQDKPLTHKQQINNFPEELISSCTYDELGNLISKKVGGSDISGESGMQKVDYSYTIRGWLKEINNIDNLTDSDGPQDLFAFKINYNTVEDVLNYTGKPLFNGNISETFWRSAGDDIKRKYGYYYDPINRMTAAVYQKPDASIPVQNCYNEYVSYDKNGNIKRLERNGVSDAPNATVTIDQLEYTYDTNMPNELVKVSDVVGNPNGFKDGINTDNDYWYDSFGNLNKDNNKGISKIIYNHLNLPTEISFDNADNSKIFYIYTATGEKVKKVVMLTSTTSISTDYLDGFQYTEEKLKFFPTAEGYVNCLYLNPTQGYDYRYVYNYTDHLGNIRLSYGLDPSNGSIQILEENHYYPFGLKHENYNSNLQEYGKESNNVAITERINNPEPVLDIKAYSRYKYKYNGKELQDELGLNMYDYGARNYDPAIGRWMNIDPLAEQYRRWSPYNYCIDNPIVFIDPDGMGVDWHPDMKGNLIADKGDNATTLANYLDVKVDRAKEILKSNDATNLQVGDKITSSEIKAVTKEIKTEIATTEKTINANNKETASLQKENKQLAAENKELKSEIKTNGTLMKSEPGDPKGGNAMAFTILNVRAENKISDNKQEIKGNNKEIQKNNTENKTAQENLNKTLDKYNVK